jgi:8-oxo-dGTP pyrophosphatase MutT (NUDIX family)/nucleoside 2-deoxyribosyltransferase
MQIIYTGQEFPESFTKSIFLAGPSPRSKTEHSWRPEMLKCLEEAGYDGVVFVPEYAPEEQYNDTVSYESVAEWEKTGMDMADIIIFWLDRDLDHKRYGLTTNLEYGERVKSGKTLLGWSPTCDKYRALQQRAEFYDAEVLYTDMFKIAVRAVLRIGDGAERIDGERYVPIDVWKLPAFRNWYNGHTQCGNKLKWADVQWTFRVGPQKQFLFLYVIYVHVWIAAEDRVKSNEVIIGRPNISTIVLINGLSVDLSDVNVVLVKEFRSPVCNSEAYVYENPGGSSFKGDKNPYELAASEVKEETGLVVSPGRIQFLGARQLNSTLSTHQSYVFACHLTDEEFKQLDEDKEVHGVIEDTERTYVETRTLQEILNSDVVDWAQVGMIFSALAVLRGEIKQTQLII